MKCLPTNTFSGAIDNSVEKVNYTSTNEISNRVRNELCDDVIDAASTNQNYRHLSQYPQSCNTSFYNSQSYLGYHQMSANNDDCHSNITFTAECVHISNNNDNNTTTNTNDYYYHNLHRCETDDQHMISQKKTQIVVPVVKRRNTANKKERRRTQSINNAFSELRDCIPNVPTDTKLSKIKTLRLATSYISYLLEVLNSNDPVLESFKADLSSHANKKAHSTYYSQIKFSQIQHKMNKVRVLGYITLFYT